MKQPLPLVLVAWVDAAAVTDAWRDRKAVIADGIRYSGEPIHACGFLIAQNEDVVMLCLAINHHNDDVNYTMAIPTKAVVSITHLRGVKGSPKIRLP